MIRGVVCQCCGIARPGELLLVGIALDRRVTVERELCRPCADRALEGMGAALDRRENGRSEIKLDGRLTLGGSSRIW